MFPLARVGASAISFCNPSGDWCNLPEAATKFIKKFDSLVQWPEKRLELPELEFEIDVPDAVVDEVDIEQVRELLKTEKHLEIYEKA